MARPPRIRVLDPAMANQIAAGEVVENPASVVKELVENSLDAGARSIRVVVEGAPTEVLKVIDDGEGMTAEEARLALERHATSKIEVPEDLVQIKTLGFRGEALPSIASVSRFTLTTRARGEVSGTQIKAVPGQPNEQKPVGTPEGTRIEVRDLFFNTPARLKFLKASSTELARITEVVTRLALCRPEVAFTFLRNGKQTRTFLSRDSLAERVREVMGTKATLREGRGSLGPVTVEAWLTPPEESRLGSRSLHVLVNGRVVRDLGLLRAVWYAYEGTLESGRYPLGVVSITIRPDLVDVNVHPQKAEVRFHDRGAVQGAIARVVKSILQQRASYLGAPAPGSTSRAPTLPLGGGSGSGGASGDWPWSDRADIGSPSPLPPLSSRGGGRTTGASFPLGSGGTQPTSGGVGAEPRYAQLRYLGPAGQTWLVCEGPDGLVIIDQHAAHERVTFERLRLAYESRKPKVQQLLVPEQAEVTAMEMDLLEKSRDQLRAIGLEIEPFSTTTVTITAVPAPLSKADPRRLLDEVLEELLARQKPLAGAIDNVLARLACHGSIRGGSRIAREEVEALLAALDETVLGGHCPHGRPVAVSLSWNELERRMGRHG